jgi:DNA-binding response OmpR family regulator
MQKRILIAEDEPHAVRILQRSLERVGYQVETSLNGEQALAMILAEHPDVLISDINMPRMNGDELCKRVRERISGQHMMIIVLTSKTEIEHRDWSRDLENTQFMEKPISIRKLQGMLKTHFDKEQQ